MRIEFDETELERLPTTVREKITTNTVENDDGESVTTHVFEGEPSEIIEDVKGLKSALEKEKENRRKLSKQVEQNGDALRRLADANMKVVIAESGGNVYALPENIKARMRWSDELGQYVVPAEDGEPLKNDDGSLKGVADIVAEMRADDRYAGLFRATLQSGSGSDPQNSGDGRSKPSSNTPADGLPPLSRSSATMSREEKVAIAKAGESFERWPM
jgi:hypothetical protein